MPTHSLRNAPLTGLVYMVAAVFLFSMMDAAAKWLTVGYPVIEIVVFSRLLSPVFAVGIALRHGGIASLHTRKIGWHALRGMAQAFTLVTFFAALIYLPLADTVAITFASPLIMCVLAIPILGEKVGIRRWAAIVVGFLGVLVITQPGGTGFGLGALLALGAAFGDAFGINIARRMSGSENSQTMLFWSSAMLLAAFGTVLPFQWVTPQGWDIAAFAIIAVIGSGAQFCLAEAFRFGEVSLLAPLEYSALIWATLFGFLLWHELPTPTVLIGVAIIVASSLYVAHREALAGRRARDAKAASGGTAPRGMIDR